MATIVLGDIVTIVKEVVNPKTCGLDKFVGLEHYDAGEPLITRYGSPENLDTNVKHFCKGDILVARRNVYLKRAGYVDFEGVTSGDSIVLRVKDPAYLRILPFLLNTEDFWDYAEQNSDGTMSKRLSPDDLLEYEFEEPADKKQLADKLWAAYRVKESYRQLLATTDDMVKAQFVELFGDIHTNTKLWKSKPWSEVCDTILGKMLDKNKQIKSDVSHRYLANINVQWGYFDLSDLATMTFSAKEEIKYQLMPNDLLLCEGGDAGRCAIWKEKDSDIFFQKALHRARIKNRNELNVVYLQFYIATLKANGWLSDYITRTTIDHLTGEKLATIPVLLPPFEVQLKFADLVEKSEATKASLRQSIDAIDRVIRSLINQ